MRFKFLIITVFLMMGFTSLIPVYSGEAQENQQKFRTDDFLKYINNEKYDYYNILVLGVDADWETALDLMNKYNFDLVIPISREGNIVEDSVRASIEKLGIPTGTLKDLKGANIKNMFAHSWGSSRSINTIVMDNIKVKNLHAIGSPHSALLSSLGESIDRGKINKVYFHINEGDNIAAIRHLPSGLQGKFSGRIEFHFYTTERNNTDTLYKKPLINIPIFNAELGFDKYTHYNSPKTGHGLEDYFTNMNSALNRDPLSSPFNGSIPPFYNVPSYWIVSNHPQSLTEAQTITEMVNNKNKSLIVGDGPVAKLMYDNISKKLGEINVYWIKNPSGNEKQIQLEARRFGADVILGVREYKLSTIRDSKLPDHDIRDTALRQDEIRKRMVPGPFPPDKFGGVEIDPQPSKAGEGGVEAKEEVLKSRPEDIPFWTVEIPEEEILK